MTKSVEFIVNGSFEDITGLRDVPGIGFYGDSGVIPGWSDLNGDPIELLNTTRGMASATDGDIWLDLEHTPGNSVIAQNVRGIEAGRDYEITFDLLNSFDDDNTVEVFWGGKSLGVFDGADAPTPVELSVKGGAGDGSNTLIFAGGGTEDNFGVGIDNVILSAVDGIDQNSSTNRDCCNEDFSETLIGTEGGDVLQAGSTGAVLLGLGGADSIEGGEKGDLIQAGDDNDTIDGMDGSDIVSGGAGNDLITDTESGSRSAGPVTTSDTTTISETSQDFSVSLTLPDSTSGASVNASGFVSTGTAVGSDVSIAFVIDVSGSAGFDYDPEENTPVEDLDGNGANNVFEAQIAGGRALVDSIVNEAGLGNAQTGIIAFNNAASIVTVGSAGDSDIFDDVIEITPDSGTNFEAALQQTLAYFDKYSAANNFVFFLSDGKPDPDSTNFLNESEELRAAPINAQIEAFAIGANASVDRLDQLDDGMLNSSVNVITDPGALATAISGTNITPADVDRLEVYLNGERVETIDGSDLTQTALGLRYDVALTNLNTSENDTVEVVAIATDSAATMVSTSQVIEQGETECLDDILQGNDGDDTIIAGLGSDSVFGGQGADNLEGGLEDDLLSGGSGTDVIAGGSGDDVLIGGEDADRFQSAAGDGFDVIEDFEVGTDVLVFDGLVFGSEAGEIDPVQFLEDNATIDGADLIIEFASDHSVRLLDVIDTSMPPADFSALAVILASGSLQPENALPVAIDDDATTDADVSQTIDLLTNDTDADGDMLTLASFTQPANGTVTDNGDGTVDYTPNLGFSGEDSFTYTVSDGNGGTDTATVTVQVGEVEGLTTPTDGDDELSGTGDNDAINGLAGNDTISGGGGNDRLIGGAGRDTVEGGDGNDFIHGHHGQDFLSGGDGNDNIRDWTGWSTLDGGAGNDNLSAGNGRDTLIGGDGNDTLTGGAKADTFQFDTQDDQDIITDFELGNDILVFDGISFGVDDDKTNPETFLLENASIDNADLVISLGQGHSVRLQNVIDPENPDASVLDFLPAISAVEPVEGTDEQDMLTGTEFADDISGGEGDDSISGLDGSDKLSGDAGNDTLTGGNGRDDLNGGSGRDSVEGGLGDDYIHGGHGRDYLSGGDGNDDIRDWTGSSTLDGGAGNDHLRAGNGRDTLIGGEGDDTLTGGAKGDYFVSGKGDGNDIITDFEIGSDVLGLTDYAFRDADDEDAARADVRALLASNAEIQDGTDLFLDLGGGRSIKLLEIVDEVAIGDEVEDYEDVFFV